jgi:hypothetical protein
MSKPVAKKKRKAISTTEKYRHVDWVALGIDASMSSISIAGTAQLKSGKRRRARAVAIRWERGTDYFERMEAASRAHTAVLDLLGMLKVMPDADQVYIAIEEPVSYGHLKRGQSAFVKQQCQISGALIGGLLRWGWKQIFEIQANSWRKIVADDLGITIHHTKWNPEGRSSNQGKYRAQEWVEKFHPKWDGHWPDLITHTKRGLIHRPEGSHAKGQQSDDRYESLAMMEWMVREIESVG